MYCERQVDGKFCIPIFEDRVKYESKREQCSECTIGRLRTQINSPIGFDASTRDSYEALVKDCKLDPAVDIVPAPKVSNETVITPEERFKGIPGYFADIQNGEGCEDFSIRTNISTTELLRVNRLYAGCMNWPGAGQKLFVPEDSVCNAYVVEDDDQCLGITRKFGIRLPEFLSWNPDINSMCTNLMVHKQKTVCVSQPGGDYIIPDSVVDAAAPSPQKSVVPRGIIAERTNSKCALYHEYRKGETCSGLMMRYGIRFPDFRFLNPSVDSVCGNMVESHHYCMKPVGSCKYLFIVSKITGVFTYTQRLRSHIRQS